jgi:ElaB/YqjD/DUF883 family membrane-anchored ribosome-binding protein
MSESLPEDAHGEIIPQPEARPPVSPPVQGAAPAWPDPVEESFPVEGKRASGFGFTLQQGGGGMTGTAERIGTAVGRAQRQMRRGLELVRRPAGLQLADSTSGAEANVSQIARDTVDRASRVVHEIEGRVSDARRQAAHRLDGWSDTAQERFQQLRGQARRALSRSGARAQELAKAYPLQTIAAVAGISFALGVALRIRRSGRG